MADHSNIVEVVETGKRQANQYLEHGYRLLAVEQCTFFKEKELQSKFTAYVEKSMIYCLGRTAQVERWEPAKREPEAVAP